MSRLLGLALTGLRAVVDGGAILLFVYMVGAIFTQVIGRYVFNFSIAGAEETATFAQIWLVLLGAGIAMRRNQHVGIDVLIVRCPPLVQRLVLIVSTGLGLWFLWVLFSGSFRLIEVGTIMRSPAMQWPMSIPYLALPLGAAYFALELALAMAPRILGRERPAADPALADQL
jgi:TRAP-type C4-dicarboxylate transport system permease small subunit